MKRISDLHELAQCPKAKICSYRPIIDNEEVQVERCEYCHRRVSYNKEKGSGRIDSNRYAQINVRSFIQPVGEWKGLFLELYGHSPLDRNKKYHLDKMKAKKQKESLQEEAKSYARYLYRTGNET